jgi:acyl-homoserine-lactone acylase
MKKYSINFLLIFGMLMCFSHSFSQEQLAFPPINPEKITIVRDTLGIAHIFAKTDAEVAYGFAWSNAEDNFKIMQETMIIGKGLSGRYEGKKGAPKDFLSQALGVKEAVDKYYGTMTPAFLKYLDGFCQGINAYAAAHKKEIILKGIFPITSKDILRTYTFISCFLAEAHKPMSAIIEGKYDSTEVPVGSNAYAVSPSKSADGHTYLAINPHQPIEGYLSFHQAHLCSEEGLNIIGAHFPIGTSIFMGNNENLGWAMTSNENDLVDTYKLKMHPRKKLIYEFDGEWKELEKRKIKLKIKMFGHLNITVSKTAYWSVYGATLASKSKKDFYSVRTSANMSCGFAEQYYYMDKATNFDEFYKALQLQGFPMFNIVYADKEGNIFFIDNGRLPKRTAGYNWKGILPGNTSKTLWQDIYKEEELPQIKNPKCGYVFNMNNAPFYATAASENLDSTDYRKFPPMMGLKYNKSNRSTRFMELIGQKDKLDFDDFKKIKFDVTLSEASPIMKSIVGIFELLPAKYPDIADGINYIKNWNHVADLSSIGAAYVALSVNYIFKKNGFGYHNFFDGAKIKNEDFAEAIAYAQNQCVTYFGKKDVTLGELQRHVRGDKNIPLPGFADALSVNYSKPYKNGRYSGYVGDSYTHFVSFSKNGPELIETLLPFGNSSDPQSKHYTDQMDDYSNQRVKKIIFSNKISDIHSERTYHPQ